MVRVNERCFDLNQIKDHLVCRGETVVQDALHHVVHARLQLVIACQLGQLHLQDKPSELFVHEGGTIEAWLEEACDLLLDEDFEGAFGHEKTRTHSRCILYCSLDVLLGKVLEWIDLAHDILEDLVEDVVDSSSTLALRCHVFHESTFELVAVLFQKLADQVQDDRAHALLIYGQVLLIVR